VQKGHDPKGVVKDPNQVIDTNFEFFRETGGDAKRQYSYEGLQVYARTGTNGSASPEPSGRQPGPIGARA